MKIAVAVGVTVWLLAMFLAGADGAFDDGDERWQALAATLLIGMAGFLVAAVWVWALKIG